MHNFLQYTIYQFCGLILAVYYLPQVNTRNVSDISAKLLHALHGPLSDVKKIQFSTPRHA